MIAQSGREAVLKQEGEATLKRALISGVALPTPAKAGCKDGVFLCQVEIAVFGDSFAQRA